MASRSVLCWLLAAAALVTGCYSGTPLPPPGRAPAPIREYWGAPDAQSAFDRVSRELTALEIDHAIALARSGSADPVTLRLATATDSARRELAALPNPLMAEIVFADRFDIALVRRQRELAVEQRLMLARLDAREPEAQRMARVVAAIADRREALHARQDTLHARFLAEPSLGAGEWIRITLPSVEGSRPRVVEGRLIELRGDSLLWQSTNGAPTTMRLPLDATVDRAVSRRGHAMEGALIGLVGAVAVAGRKRGPFDDQGSLRAIALAPLGALFGGLIGATVYSETWAPVVWYRPSALTAPSAIGVGARWTPPAGWRRSTVTAW